MAEKKFNFDFNLNPFCKSKDVHIMSAGKAYFSVECRSRLNLTDSKWRWGEDKENHRLCIKKDENGRRVDSAGCMILHGGIAQEYLGNYRLELVEEGVYVLEPIK